MDGQMFSVETPSAGTIQGLRWGPRGAAPLLAVHGWLDNAASFARLASYLPQAQLVAIDLPGHGHSQHRPAGSRYHLLDYVPVLLEVADALSWPKMSILGHSLGGAIAALAAVVAPARVKAMVLIEGLGPASESPEKVPTRLRDSIKAHGEMHNKAAAVYSDLESIVTARARVGQMSEAAARALVMRNIYKEQDGYRWRSDPRLRLPSPVFLTEPQVLAYLSAIEIPTQVLLAKEGVLAKRESLELRLAALKAGEVQWLAGKHHLHMDDPEPVAGAIQAFLSNLGAA